MNLIQIRWSLAVAAAVGMMATLVALAYLYVAFYSYVIHPGEAFEFYQAHARISSPIIGIAGGLPLFFFVARWITARTNRRTALAAWGICALISLFSLAMVAAADRIEASVLICVLDIPPKFAATWMGARTKYGGARSYPAGLDEAAGQPRR